MSFRFGQPVTFRHRADSGTRDGDGATVYTNVDTVIQNCGFDPGGSTEMVQGGDVVTTQPTVFLPPGAQVPVAIDAVIVNSFVFEVDGSPSTYTNPFTGWSPGTAVRLKQVTG